MQKTVSVKGIDEILKKFSARNIETAARRAVKLATAKGKTYMSRQVTSEFNIRKSDVDRKINVTIRKGGLSAELVLTGEPISLMHFGAREIRGGEVIYGKRIAGTRHYELLRRRTRLKGAGIQVRIKKGQITKLMKPITIDGEKFSKAWIGKGRGGTVLVFRRRLEDKVLSAQKTLGYASILKQKKNINAVIKIIEETLNGELNRQLNEVLK